MNENTSLEVRPTQMSVAGVLEGSTNRLDAIDRMAEWFTKSGLFGCDRPAQGAILALTCMSEGITPLEFSRTYDIVEGKIRKKAMAAFAEFRRRGGNVKWTKTGDDGIEAAAEFTYEGQTVSLRYSFEQAQKAGLVKPRGGWEKNPANMLRARLISNALGMLAPEIYAGDIEDGDSGDRPAPSIALGATPTPAKVVTTVPTREMKPAKVTEQKLEPAVAAPVEVVAEAATVSPAVVHQEPGPTPMPSPTADEVLPEAIQIKLVEVIGAERMPQAAAYCIAVGWLAPGQDMECLKLARANQILAKADRFIAAMEKHGGAN